MTEPHAAADPMPEAAVRPGATVVRAESPQAFLRMVPMLAGLQPADSVVLVLFERNRTRGAMRVDLPPDDDPLRLQRWATELIGMVCKVRGVTAVIPVVYTPATFAPGGRVPRAAVLRALNRRAHQAGVTVRELFCVAADGWGSPDDADLPRGGRDLAEIEPLPLDAHGGDGLRNEVPSYASASAAGSAVFLDQIARWWCTVGGPLGPDRAPLHGVDLRRPGNAVRHHGRHEGSAFHRIRFGEENDAVVALVEAALQPHDEDPDRPCPCRALLHCLARRQGLNGIAVVQMGWGPEIAVGIWAASRDGTLREGRGDPLGERIGGLTTEAPDAERLRIAIRVLLAVGSYVPAPARAGLDSMLAWLHWSLGASSVAVALAERALDQDPDQDLATAVRRLAVRLPEWAYGEPDLAVPA